MQHAARQGMAPMYTASRMATSEALPCSSAFEIRSSGTKDHLRENPLRQFSSPPRHTPTAQDSRQTLVKDRGSHAVFLPRGQSSFPARSAPRWHS